MAATLERVPLPQNIVALLLPPGRLGRSQRPQKPNELAIYPKMDNYSHCIREHIQRVRLTPGLAFGNAYLECRLLGRIDPLCGCGKYADVHCLSSGYGLVWLRAGDSGRRFYC